MLWVQSAGLLRMIMNSAVTKATSTHDDWVDLDEVKTIASVDDLDGLNVVRLRLLVPFFLFIFLVLERLLLWFLL